MKRFMLSLCGMAVGVVLVATLFIGQPSKATAGGFPCVLRVFAVTFSRESIMRWLVLLLCLVACTAPMPRAAITTATVAATPQPVAIASPTRLTPAPPLVATRDPQFTPRPRPTLSAPMASPSERQAASPTWLYLTAFQSYNLSVIDPHSGHVLRELSVQGEQAGLAISPDGTRLYIVDGGRDGELRIYDTQHWQVLHREPITNLHNPLGGNRVSLSGNGRWLVVGRYEFERNHWWASVFDTMRLRWLSDDVVSTLRCVPDYTQIVQLAGRPSHSRLYADCNGSVISLDADTLSPLWRTAAPSARKPVLVLAPDGKRLYGLYPQVAISYASGSGRVTLTDLWLSIWETVTSRDSANALLVQQIRLSDRVTIPTATFGRGESGYLAISPDGARLYIAWEDRLWTLASGSLQVMGELKLPTAVDGLAVSVDGRELYLLPATAGDLKTRAQGMWIVDAASLQIMRRVSDWPAWQGPFFFAAPAP